MQNEAGALDIGVAYAMLQNRVFELEKRVAELEKQIPETDVISTNFWNRAFAIWGHALAANMLLTVLVMAAFILLSLATQ